MTHVVKIIIMDELAAELCHKVDKSPVRALTASKQANDSENNTRPSQPCAWIRVRATSSYPDTHSPRGAACSTRANVWAANSQKHNDC